MNIIKRNGTTQDFRPEKVLGRIKNQSEDLEGVTAELVFKKVIPSIQDDMTTTEIDEILAFTCADLIIRHPDYSLLGGRILMSRQAKIIRKRPQDYDKTYDFFSAYTFLNKYSLKNEDELPIELPHMMIDRVVNALADNPEEQEAFRTQLLNKKINCATPIYTNSGSGSRKSAISCNLTHSIGDNTEGILQTLSDISTASRDGAGIGLLADNIRSKESVVSSFKGKAGGIIRYADMVQSHMRFFKQGSRAGSSAMYLSVWHRDIIDFLELRLKVGDEVLRTRDIFLAVVIDDVFMNALINGTTWHLFCPNDILKNGLKPLEDLWGDEFKAEYNKAVALGIGKEVDPKTIWDFILKSQVDNGNPYVLYKDNANRRNMQRNIGVIKQSNLCVAPNTQILTESGYECIGDLENDKLKVWNGEEFSEVTIRKTGENKELVRVTTNSGYTLDCTPYHKFYIRGKKLTNKHSPRYEIIEKRANELKVDDRLIKFKLPIIEGHRNLQFAYDNGFYSGDGCITRAGQRIYLYHEKRDLEKYLPSIKKWYVQDDIKRMYGHTRGLQDKFFVPSCEYTVKDRLTWLAGFLDADGTVTNNNGSQSIQAASVEINFLKEIQLMLQTLGVDSKVMRAQDAGVRSLPKNDGSGELGEFECKATSRLLINGNSLYKLITLGLTCHRLKWEVRKPNRECSQFIKVEGVVALPNLSDTYCFTEPKRNMGMFNGILTGNCIEILQASKPNYTPQCTLSSLNLGAHDDIDTIITATKTLVRLLNRVIDNNMWSNDACELAGEEQRALAIGVAGLADFFAKKKISFESAEAEEWTHRIFTAMYKASVEESMKMAEEEGNYPAWEGSPYSEGETYIEGWSPLEKGVPIPMRNSLLLGLMPTASSAILLGVFESFEPVTSNLFVRTVGQGEFLVLNKHLVKELEELNLWDEQMSNLIIKYDGSVQHIEEIPDDIKYRYKTVWEIPQRALIDLAAIRNKYVDQSQSMNLYFKEAKYGKISAALVHGWKQGLKTGVYYTRTKSTLGLNTKLADVEQNKVVRPDNSIFSCEGGGCDA